MKFLCALYFFLICTPWPVYTGHDVSLGKGEAAIFEQELDG